MIPPKHTQYQVRHCPPVIAAWLAERLASTAWPLAPPPAAATAWLASLGGTGRLVNVASFANSAGCPWMAASSGWNFFAFASPVLGQPERAMTKSRGRKRRVRRR
jgi:hypothetical protein